MKSCSMKYKMYQLCCKSGKQYEIFKTRPRHPTILQDLKWINFNSILRLNEASFMYKNQHVSADSNVKKINFDLRNKVTQRKTRNGSDVHIDYRRTAVGQSCIGRKAVEFDPDKYQKLKYHRYVQKSYVPTPRAPITNHVGEIPNLFYKSWTFVSSFTQSDVTCVNCNTNQLGKITDRVKLLALLNYKYMYIFYNILQ